MSEAQQPETMRDEDEVSLLDLLIVLAKHKTLVLGLPAAAAVISAVVSLLLPNYYTGITKILPPQQTQSTSAVLAQLGNLAGLAGGPAVAGLKNPNDLYVGMLKSRTVADNLIQRFDLNTRKTEKLLEGVNEIDLSANGEKLLYQQGQKWAIVSTSTTGIPGAPPSLPTRTWTSCSS